MSDRLKLPGLWADAFAWPIQPPAPPNPLADLVKVIDSITASTDPYTIHTLFRDHAGTQPKDPPMNSDIQWQNSKGETIRLGVGDVFEYVASGFNERPARFEARKIGDVGNAESARCVSSGKAEFDGGHYNYSEGDDFERMPHE